MLRKCRWLILVVVLLGAGFGAGIFYKRLSPNYHRITENFIFFRDTNDEKAAGGCLLFSPYADVSATDGPTVFLTDKKGKTVREWSTGHRAKSAKLDSKRNLWTLTTLRTPGDIFLNFKTLIQKTDWNGNVVYQREVPYAHHDFDILNDDEVITVVYEEKPVAKRVFEGDSYDIHTEIVAIANLKTGEIKRLFDLWNRIERGKAEVFDHDEHCLWHMYHVNSIQFIPKTGIYPDSVVLTMRDVSLVVRMSLDGRILQKWKHIEMNFPHDGQLLSNGDLLVFSNNEFPPSSILQLNEKSEKVWEYCSFRSNQFFNFFSGSTKRLKNGNTFISNSLAGQFLEVTPRGEVVFDVVQRRRSNEKNSWIFTQVHSVEHYDGDYFQEPIKECR